LRAFLKNRKKFKNSALQLEMGQEIRSLLETKASGGKDVIVVLLRSLRRVLGWLKGIAPD
jgi:hypothetical protein